MVNINLFYILGLVGVYYIGDYYEYEIFRGVEDVFCMVRVMYGESYFDRFLLIRLCYLFFRGVRYMNSGIFLCKIKNDFLICCFNMLWVNFFFILRLLYLVMFNGIILKYL